MPPFSLRWSGTLSGQLEGPFAGKQASEAAAAQGGSCMALEACVEELLVLMDQEVRAHSAL